MPKNLKRGNTLFLSRKVNNRVILEINDDKEKEGIWAIARTMGASKDTTMMQIL